METSLVLFYILGAVTLGGGLGVVVTRNIVYAAPFLLLSLGGVAGLYLLLFAEFLALVQVLIYGGAIIIVLLFAIMLTRLQDFRGGMSHRQWPLALVASAALFGILTAIFVRDQPSDTRERFGVDFEALGSTLFQDWAIPFEVASLVLLVALIGAVVIARAGGRE